MQLQRLAVPGPPAIDRRVGEGPPGVRLGRPVDPVPPHVHALQDALQQVLRRLPGLELLGLV